MKNCATHLLCVATIVSPYFDTQARFRIMGFQQEGFESLHAQDLLPMAPNSPACLCLGEAPTAMLKSAEETYRQGNGGSDYTWQSPCHWQVTQPRDREAH